MVATRDSSGIPPGFFEVDLLLLSRFGSGVLLDLPARGTSSSLTISLLFDLFFDTFVKMLSHFVKHRSNVEEM